MNDLKPCQKEVEALEIIESMLDVADMKNTGPIYADDPPRSGLCRIPEEDAAILRQYIADRRAQPANEPLTIDELREMGGEPVWCVYPECSTGGEWFLVNSQGVYKNGSFLNFRYYGEWMAYAHEPGGEHDGN